MNNTFLTTEELSARIKYDPRTIRDQLKDSVLLEGRHYFRPFGGRKILYIWESVEQDMFKAMCVFQSNLPPIPVQSWRSFQWKVAHSFQQGSSVMCYWTRFDAIVSGAV